MENMKKTININIRVSEDLREKLGYIAKELYTTQSQLVLQRILKEIKTGGEIATPTLFYAPKVDYVNINMRMFPEVKSQLDVLVDKSDKTLNQYLVDLVTDIVAEFEGVR